VKAAAFILRWTQPEDGGATRRSWHSRQHAFGACRGASCPGGRANHDRGTAGNAIRTWGIPSSPTASRSRSTGGYRSALLSFSVRAGLILACDRPDIPVDLCGLFSKSRRLRHPRTGDGRLNPLCAVWSRPCFPQCRRIVEGRLKFWIAGRGRCERGAWPVLETRKHSRRVGKGRRLKQMAEIRSNLHRVQACL
jgi:hypothetical protein